MVKIYENINRIFEDAEFDKIFDQTLKDNQMNKEKSMWADLNNVNIKHLDVPIEKQKNGYTYMYAEDYNTAKKLVSSLDDYFDAKNFDVDADIDMNIDSAGSYEPIGENLYDFLSTGWVYATMNPPKGKSGKRIYFEVLISSIRVDAPQFDRFEQDNKFVVCLTSNIMYKISKEDGIVYETRLNVLNDVRNIIKKSINDNWKFRDYTQSRQN